MTNGVNLINLICACRLVATEEMTQLPVSPIVIAVYFQVLATDLDCGVDSQVRYAIKDLSQDVFRIEEATGRICLARELDHEREAAYDFTVVASDLGGLSTSTMVKIEVSDVNDNVTQFEPAA